MTTIEQVLEGFVAGGVTVALTPSEKVRITGPAAAIEKAAEVVRDRRAEFVTYLRAQAPEQHEILEIGDAGPLLKTCPRCGHTIVPAARVQIENFKIWQRQHTSIYHWAPEELERLESKLGPFDLLVPDFAASVTIRRADGTVARITRQELAENIHATN